MLLEDEGHRVLQAENGERALELMPLERPELVVLDIMMPLLDGREVLRRLQAMRELEATHVILMSAAVRPTPEYRVAAFLPKPFDFEQLLEIIDDLLGTS